MITINKIIQVTGQLPISYSWSSDIPGVSFSTGTTSTDGLIQTVVTFASETVLTNATITLTVTSACGNSLAQEITFTNVCSSLTLTDPTVTRQGSDYVFTVLGSTAAENCAALNFNWIYDTQVWDRISINNSSFTSSIRLRLRPNVNPASSVITIQASDCTGCEETVEYTYSFCRPVSPAVVTNLYTNGFSYQGNTLTLPVPIGCTDFVPDWSTLIFNVPAQFTNVSTTPQQILLTTPNTTPVGVYQGSWTVRDAFGVESVAGPVTIIVNPTTSTNTPTISGSNQVIILECAVEPGDVIEIPIRDNLVLTPGTVIDYSSFQLVTPPVPLGTIDPVLGTNSNGDRVIRYTVPSPVAQDAFSWIIRDTNGNPSQAITYTTLGCVQAIQAEDDAYTVVCGSTTSFNVLQNDIVGSGAINPNSLQVVAAPTQGLATISSGQIQYIAPAGYSGEITFTYRVADVFGTFSNDATVTVTVVCAGADAQAVLCN